MLFVDRGPATSDTPLSGAHVRAPAYAKPCNLRLREKIRNSSKRTNESENYPA
jgi:hypothetical protein